MEPRTKGSLLVFFGLGLSAANPTVSGTGGAAGTGGTGGGVMVCTGGVSVSDAIGGVWGLVSVMDGLSVSILVRTGGLWRYYSPPFVDVQFAHPVSPLSFWLAAAAAKE